MEQKTTTKKKLDLEPYFRFYLGCECKTPEGTDVLKGVYENSTPVLYNTVKDYPYSKITLILRRLHSITKEEASLFGRIFFQLKEGEFQLDVYKSEQFFKLVEKSGSGRMITVDWSGSRVCVDELDRYGVPVHSDNALTDAIAFLIKQKFWVWSTDYFDEGLIVEKN